MNSIEQGEEGSEVHAGDALLRALVRLANEAKLEFGITLQFGGMLVTGQVIPFSKYLPAFVDQFASGFSDADLGQEVRAAFGLDKDDQDSSSEQKSVHPRYIHLEDVKFFDLTGSAIPSSSSSVLWRGRLSGVSGFILGALKQDESAALAPQESP